MGEGFWWLVGGPSYGVDENVHEWAASLGTHGMQQGLKTSGGVCVSAGHYWLGGVGDDQLDPPAVLRVGYARHHPRPYQPIDHGGRGWKLDIQRIGEVGGRSWCHAVMKCSAVSCCRVIPRPAQTAGLAVTIACRRPTSQSTSSAVTTVVPGLATALSDCGTGLLLLDGTPLGPAPRWPR